MHLHCAPLIDSAVLCESLNKIFHIAMQSFQGFDCDFDFRGHSRESFGFTVYSYNTHYTSRMHSFNSSLRYMASNLVIEISTCGTERFKWRVWQMGRYASMCTSINGPQIKFELYQKLLGSLASICGPVGDKSGPFESCRLHKCRTHSHLHILNPILAVYDPNNNK